MSGVRKQEKCSTSLVDSTPAETGNPFFLSQFRPVTVGTRGEDETLKAVEMNRPKEINCLLTMNTSDPQFALLRISEREQSDTFS